MNLLNLTISTLHEGYRSKAFTVTEVTKAYLARIKQYNPLLHAYLTLTEEVALQSSERLDAQLKEDLTILETLPLFGVPIALKDLFLTKGVRTTAASKVLDTYVPQYSAVAWERLEGAGAILLGKLNCDAWAHGASGENSDYGPTKNPWDVTRVPGGSSSGSAAAVSADLALVSMGTDTGGSIRQPASFCGVTGLKPTYGRVPRYGVVAMASSLDCVGHMCKSTEDVARVLSVTAGHSDKDATTPQQAVPDYVKNIRQLPKNLTVGVPKEYFTNGMNQEIVKQVEAALDQLKSLGMKVKEISLPNTAPGLAVYYIVQPSEVSSNLARYDGIRYGLDRSTFGDEAKRRIMLGTYTLSAGYYNAYYKKAMQVRTLLIQDFQKAFEEVDIIAGPVSPILPFKIGEKTTDPLQMYLCDVLTVTANLVGVPGLSLPCGFSSSNLPIGFQILGPYFSEQLLFQVGYAYQQATDWHTRSPQL